MFAVDVTLEESTFQLSWKYDVTYISMDMRFKEALLSCFTDENPEIVHLAAYHNKQMAIVSSAVL